jgi:uncharacterized membrane protein
MKFILRNGRITAFNEYIRKIEIGPGKIYDTMSLSINRIPVHYHEDIRRKPFTARNPSDHGNVMTAHMSFELTLVLSSFLIFGTYHIHLIYQTRKDPESTSYGVTGTLRRSWVQMIMSEKRDILAVQTLRNWIMAASFFASTSILISLGTINLLFRGETVPGIFHALNIFGSRSEALWLIKIIILAMDFFFAFFNFALTIRYYNHVNFMINVSPDRDSMVTADAVSKALNMGTIHYTLGMRSYYVAVPFTLWLFGPALMLVGTIVITTLLYKLDRTA